MYFTQDDYKKIEAWLYQRSVKDTDLPKAAFINRTDRVPIVQEGKNKVIGFNDFLQQVISLNPSYFYNVSANTCKKLTLEEAIALIPDNQKKLGLVITFCNKRGNWMIYQFIGSSLKQWNDIYSWENIIQEALKDLLFWPDEEDITYVQDGNKRFLKFRDREVNPEEFIGMGMVILRRNYEGVACNCSEECECAFEDDKLINVLTQDMINKPNTVYIVEYDFDLNGQSIVVPQNSVLWFQGGSINNGSLYLNETAILGAFEFADMGNALLFGTFNKGQVMTFKNDEYKKKEGNYFSAYFKASSATREEDPKQETEVTYIENKDAYKTSERQELRWWNGEEWVLILDITDYNEIKSIIEDFISKHNAEMSACYRYFKVRCYLIEKRLDAAESDIDTLESDLAALAEKLRSFLEDSDTKDTTINRWKEIENFLQGITDTETLTGLLEELKSELIGELTNKPLTIKLANGDTVYDGKEAKTVTITPESIGAAKTPPTGFSPSDVIDASRYMLAVYVEGMPYPDAPYEEWKDVSTITVPGNYRIQNCKGLPADSYPTGKNPLGHTDYGQLLVLRGDIVADNITQIYFDWFENGGVYIKSGTIGIDWNPSDFIKRDWVRLGGVNDEDIKKIIEEYLKESLVASKVSHKLTFTGNSGTIEYDGSADVKISIPSRTSIRGYTSYRDVTYEGGSSIVYGERIYEIPNVAEVITIPLLRFIITRGGVNYLEGGIISPNNNNLDWIQSIRVTKPEFDGELTPVTGKQFDSISCSLQLDCKDFPQQVGSTLEYYKYLDNVDTIASLNTPAYRPQSIRCASHTISINQSSASYGHYAFIDFEIDGISLYHASEDNREIDSSRMYRGIYYGSDYSVEVLILGTFKNFPLKHLVK